MRQNGPAFALSKPRVQLFCKKRRVNVAADAEIPRLRENTTFPAMALSYTSAFNQLPSNSREHTASLRSPLGTGEDLSQPQDHGTLVSFISHAAYLEERLRSENPVFFDDRVRIKAESKCQIGSGTSFVVERAEWTSSFNEPPDQLQRWGTYIVIKTVLRGPSTQRRIGSGMTLKSHALQVLDRERTNWSAMLLEIRSLLHEPIRYHPNIVRLLGLGWGSSSESDSMYPMLVLEHATFGSLYHLQAGSPPLPFAIKQKLCYDVARGLAVLHACGIIHGDVKDRNVLVFKNRGKNARGQPYTAKLADFGGAVMDISGRHGNTLAMPTPTFQAPEVDETQLLSPEGLKRTDMYSFGMLVWNTLIDGNLSDDKGLARELELEAVTERELHALKKSDELLCKAIRSVTSYASINSLCSEAVNLVLHVLDLTIQLAPAR